MKERKPTAAQLAALRKGREAMAKKRANAKKDVKKSAPKTKKPLKKGLSGTKKDVVRMTEAQKNKLRVSVRNSAYIASKCNPTDKDDIRFVKNVYKKLDDLADKIASYHVTPVTVRT